jgi:hypothetical protein
MHGATATAGPPHGLGGIHTHHADVVLISAPLEVLRFVCAMAERKKVSITVPSKGGEPPGEGVEPDGPAPPKSDDTKKPEMVRCCPFFFK